MNTSIEKILEEFDEKFGDIEGWTFKGDDATELKRFITSSLEKTWDAAITAAVEVSPQPDKDGTGTQTEFSFGCTTGFNTYRTAALEALNKLKLTPTSTSE